MRTEADFLASAFGHDSMEIVPPQQMHSHIVGGDYHGGIYDRRGGHFHPLNYALGLAQAARGKGVLIFEHSAVARLSDAPAGKVIAQCAEGSVIASYAILAADTWTKDLDRQLGRYTIPIINYNIATAPIPNADALLPSDAAVADSRFVLNYFRLSADKRMIFGGGEKYVQRPPRDIAAFVRPHLASVFPSLAQHRIDYAWGGSVGVTLNRLPQIGRKGNVFHAHGFSGHGALVTTLAGELMAEAVMGTIGRFDIFAQMPHKPFPGGPLLARPLATLGLLWFALRDRL